MREVILYGVGSPITVDIEESCHRLGVHVVAAVHNIEGANYYSDPNDVIEPENLTENQKRLSFVLPLFTPGHRKAAYEDARRYGLTQTEVLVDPTTILARSTDLGAGVYINAGCVIGASGSIDDFVFINRSASIGHHVTLEKFVSIGPGSVLSGCVSVGRGAMIGGGSVLLPEVSIGSNAVVGAGSVVTKPVPAGCLVVGNPAQIVKRDIQGYKGISV